MCALTVYEQEAEMVQNMAEGAKDEEEEEAIPTIRPPPLSAPAVPQHMERCVPPHVSTA